MTDLNIVKRVGTKSFINYERLQEIQRCMNDPIYFIETYTSIQHPTRGMVPFEMYDFQKDLVKHYDDNRFSVSLLSRQMGKTTTAAMYLLWVATFRPDQTILVVANQQAQALEIMHRIRAAYEDERLPEWMRVEAKSINKGSIEFANGSRIISRATTGKSGRGLSISLLYVDELGFVEPYLQSEFWSAVLPTLSTGGRMIVTSTPSSDEDIFATVWHGACDNIDPNTGTERPGGIGKNGFKAFKALYDRHPDRQDPKWAEEERARLGEEKFRREVLCVEHKTMITYKDDMSQEKNIAIGDLFELMEGED